MLKKLRPVVIELSVILSPSYVCCDDYFIFICFRKFAISLFDKNKSVFEILLTDIAMKISDCQLKLMALITVYVEVCVRGNVPICRTKLIGINMQNLAVAGVVVVQNVIVISKGVLNLM